MRTLVIGDIHGAYKALLQALERAKYDPDNDFLIFLGDVADGWPEVKQVFDFIVAQPRKLYLMGNHDEWMLEWADKGGWADGLWWNQGGMATIQSYYPEVKFAWQTKDIPVPRFPEAHLQLLREAKFYHVDHENRMFVHGGFSPAMTLWEHDNGDFTWDRSLWSAAQHEEAYRQRTGNTFRGPLTQYKEVFIGHTTTSHYSDVPLQQCEVWNLDQGAGWEGKLSVMDIDTHEFWQSDKVKTLYPDVKGQG